MEPLILRQISINASYILSCVSGIITSFLIGMLLFKEKTGWKGYMGIFLSVIALILVTL